MSIALLNMFAKRHQHEWEQTSEVTVESFFERYQGTARFPNMGAWVFERKTVSFMRCKCGKKKRVIVSHPWSDVAIMLFKRTAERHKHEWEKISEVLIESVSERFQGGISRLPNMGTWMYERKTVTHLRCKCGKMKRVILAHP